MPPKRHARALSPHGLGRCRECGKPIRWTTTERGARLAVDVDPDPVGNVAARLDHMQIWRSRKAPVDRRELAPLEAVFMPHVATCATRQAPPPEQLELPEPADQVPDNVIPFDLARRRRKKP